GKSQAVSEDDAQDFANAMLAAHNSGIVVIDKEEDIAPVAANSNGEAFVAYNDVAKQGITTYLLGQTLTSGTDNGGTYGQGKIHQEQQEIIFNSDRKHALKAVQRFIDIICLANGYDAPEFKWIAKKVIPVDQLDADKKAYDMGLRFNKSYFVDELGYEERHISHVETFGSATTLPISAKANSFASQKWLPFKAADSDSEFTDEQQELERVADDALNASVQPFDTNAVLSAISNTTDADSLREALFNLCGEGLAESEFTQLVNTALMVADVHGFAD